MNPMTNPYQHPQHGHPQQAYPHQQGYPQMAPQHAGGMAFKFTFVRGGRAASVFAKEGMITPHGLVLDGRQLPMGCIQDTETRDRRIVMALAHPQMIDPGLHEFIEEGFVVIEVRSPGARDVEMTIDRFASYQEAETCRQQLAVQGREHEFRVVTCPYCASTVNLTGLAQTEYYYCRYCSSIHNHMRPLGQTEHYRTCDECSMFDRNQSYTEFYFYFLLIVYGFSYSRRHMCDNCARGLFWKAFLINALFLLGVPSAFWIRIKSSMGREPSLARLADANRRALKGDAQGARAIFAELHGVLPNHPGLLVNEARAHLNAGDPHTASAMLHTALAACPTYLPANDMIEEIRQRAYALPQGA